MKNFIIKNLINLSEKRPYKLNFIGRIVEKILSLLNNERQAWMVGAVVRKKRL